jgi:hypothetical protein
MMPCPLLLSHPAQDYARQGANTAPTVNAGDNLRDPADRKAAGVRRYQILRPAQWTFCCLRKSARQLAQSSKPDAVASSMVR